MSSVRDLEVKHGYTLHDLDQMSRAAVVADRSLAADIGTRRDIAWSAIALYLAESEELLSRQELIRIGWQAIYRDARDAYRQRGRPDDAWSSTEGFTPRFAIYWNERQITPSHEHRVVESIAADQVLEVLTPIYRDAIVALSVHEDYRTAAATLGIEYSAFTVRISTARKRLLAAWFEGETPHKVRQTDRRVGAYDKELATHCSKGHEWTQENTQIRHRILRGKPHRSRVCRACEHDRSVARHKAKKEAIAA